LQRRCEMDCRLWLVLAVVVLTLSCTRQARTDRLMKWSEGTHFQGMILPRGEKIVVMRYVDDPGQGVIEDGTPALRERLTRLGNPVQVTFDCWRHFGGTFGFNIIAIGGETYFSASNGGPSRAGAFIEGPSRPNPLESAVPE
jgi:hypothetical protein